MLQTIVGALLPVIVTLLLGVLAGWRGDEDKKAATALNTMVLVYATPLLLFAGTVTTSRESLAAEMPLAATLLVGLVGPAIMAYLAARFVFRRDVAASALQGMCFGFPAVIFTGVPILTPLIGERTTAVIAWSGIIDNIVVLPMTFVLLSMAQDEAEGESLGRIVGKAMIHALKQPVVVAPILAIVLVVVGVRVSADVISAMKLLGGTVGGVSLFASGVILQAQGITLSWPALVSALGRVLVVPGLAFLTMAALHPDAELRKMVVLALALAATPMQVILSVRYKVHEKENAALLLYSNLLSIPGLAFFIWLLG